MNFWKRLGSAARYAATGQTRSRMSLHEAAAKNRRLKNFSGTNADINAILRASGDELVRRARQLVAHNPYAANAKEAWSSALIGAGIRPASTIQDPVLREQVMELWKTWCDESDSEGVTSFYGLQDIAGGALFDAGEGFVRLRPRRLSDGLAVPLQLQALDAAYLDRTYSLDLPNGHRIKSGIEFNRIGRRVGYWFWKEHPGDSLARADHMRTRVPAEDVLHIYEMRDAGQIRGFPKIAPAMIRMRLLDDYDDYELDRKRVAALIAAFITTPEDPNEDAPYANEESTDTDGIATAEWEPGTVQFLEPGEEVKFSDPADVGGNYEAFQLRNLYAISAAMGISYHLVTNDVSKANYSSLRAALVEYRRRITRVQKKTIAFQLCRPVWSRFIDQALLSGALRGDARILKTQVQWIPPKWDWVDPLKDRKAEQLALEMGTKARSGSIIEEGGDPEEVDRQRAADEEREARHGLSSGVDDISRFEDEKTEAA